MAKFFEQLNSEHVTKFNGILILGDIHGNINAFDKAIKYASKNSLYILSLGDIVDYGQHSAEVVKMTSVFVNEGLMSVVYGNHERKAQKYFEQKRAGTIRVSVKPSLQSTIDSFEKFTDIEETFLTLCKKMVNVFVYNQNWFTHGAIHPALYERKEYFPEAYNYALFGEVDHNLPIRSDGFPNRVFNWVKHIPENHRVFVGHDVRSDSYPVIQGNAFFLDTGCSKKGLLSGVVLDNLGLGQNIHVVQFN